MHTRQCSVKGSEATTETKTLAAVSATSTDSYHLIFATEKDTNSNLLTVQNLTVTAGKSTEDVNVGTVFTMYDDIGFAKNKTQTATDMNLDFQAETLNANTYSYQNGFRELCSLTEADFLSSSGGSCENKDKSVYKILLETTYTVVERKADINLAPDATRVK